MGPRHSTLLSPTDLYIYPDAGVPPQSAYPLGKCVGHCKDDDDCGTGLSCFKRSKLDAVPGCDGGEVDNSRTDYCIVPEEMTFNVTVAERDLTAAGLGHLYAPWNRNCWQSGDRLPGFGGWADKGGDSIEACAYLCKKNNYDVPCDVIEFGPTWGCFKCTDGLAELDLRYQGENKYNMKTYKRVVANSCPNLSDKEGSKDPSCICNSLVKSKRIELPATNGKDAFACVLPDYSETDCTDAYDCDPDSKCACVKADEPFNGCNQKTCIPDAGAAPGQPCYTSKLCASDSDCLHVSGNSNKGYCSKKDVEVIGAYTKWNRNCWETRDRPQNLGGGDTFEACAEKCKDFNNDVPCDVIEFGSNWGCFTCTDGLAESDLASQGKSKYNMKVYKKTPIIGKPQIRGTLYVYPDGGAPPENAYPLGECEGHCMNDDDCGKGLSCFKRSKLDAVPGCVGGEIDKSRTDYCARITKPPDSSFSESIVLTSDESLDKGIFVFSPNGKFKVGLTSVGDLVLQDKDSNTIWSAKSSGGHKCFMQTDGNVVVRDIKSAVLWTSGTGDNNGASLVVDDGGYIAVIHDAYGAIWLDGIPRGEYDGPSSNDLSFPVRGVFYYPWYPDTWEIGDKLAHFKPDLGYYSSSNPLVAEAHIDAFKYAHVDLSIASWWGPDSNLERARLTMLMDKTIAMQSQVKWTIYYEPSKRDLKEDLDYLKKWFAWHPTWAHQNGLPVIFVYNIGPYDTGPCDSVKRWMDAADGEWYVVMKLFKDYTLCDTQPDHWVSHACVRSAFMFFQYGLPSDPLFQLLAPIRCRQTLSTSVRRRLFHHCSWLLEGRREQSKTRPAHQKAFL
jgi:hypothetical protein